MGSFCRGRDGTRRIVARDKKEEPTGFVVVVLEGKCNIATGTSFDCTNIDERIIIIIIKEEEEERKERGVAPAAKNWHGPTSTFHRLSMGIDDGAQGENVCADLRDLLPLFSSMTGDESSPPRFTSRAKSSLLSSSPLSIGPLHKKTEKKDKKKKHFHRTGNVAYARLLQLPGDVSATRYERGGVVDPWRKDTWTWREFIITAPKDGEWKQQKEGNNKNGKISKVIGREWGKKKKGEFLFGLCRSRTKSRGTTEPRLRGGGCWKREEKENFHALAAAARFPCTSCCLEWLSGVEKATRRGSSTFCRFHSLSRHFSFFAVWGLPYCKPAWPRSVHAGGARKREKKETKKKKNFPNK